MTSFGGDRFAELVRYEVIDFCRNGVMPFTFHEKMRIVSGSGGPASLDGGGCGEVGGVT
jgi:hypothetical protein